MLAVIVLGEVSVPRVIQREGVWCDGIPRKATSSGCNRLMAQGSCDGIEKPVRFQRRDRPGLSVRLHWCRDVAAATGARPLPPLPSHLYCAESAARLCSLLSMIRCTGPMVVEYHSSDAPS